MQLGAYFAADEQGFCPTRDYHASCATAEVFGNALTMNAFLDGKRHRPCNVLIEPGARLLTLPASPYRWPAWNH